jgi:hypothetical protein
MFTYLLRIIPREGKNLCKGKCYLSPTITLINQRLYSKRNMVYGTLCLMSTPQSQLQYMNHGQPYTRVDLNPTPESTLSPSQGLWTWARKYLPLCEAIY